MSCLSFIFHIKQHSAQILKWLTFLPIVYHSLTHYFHDRTGYNMAECYGDGNYATFLQILMQKIQVLGTNCTGKLQGTRSLKHLNSGVQITSFGTK